MGTQLEAVLSQLTERYHAKRIWARNVWHLTARWLRKLVSHTMAVLLCQRTACPRSASLDSSPHETGTPDLAPIPFS